MAKFDSHCLPERKETIRKAILQALQQGPCSAKDLSGAVGVREKEVTLHLGHLQKSCKKGPWRLNVEPAHCRSCGFVFRKRERLSKPSSCPRCRKQYIDPPLFWATSSN